MPETKDVKIANLNQLASTQQSYESQGYKMIGSQSIGGSDEMIIKFEKVPIQEPIPQTPTSQVQTVTQPTQPIPQETLVQPAQPTTPTQPDIITQSVTSFNDVALQQKYMADRGYTLTSQVKDYGANPTEQALYYDIFSKIDLTFTKTSNTGLDYIAGSGKAAGYDDLTNTALQSLKTTPAPDSGVTTLTQPSMPDTSMTITKSDKPNLYVQAIESSTGNVVSIPNPEALKDPTNLYLNTTTTPTGESVSTLVKYTAPPIEAPKTTTTTKLPTLSNIITNGNEVQYLSTLATVDAKKTYYTNQGYTFTGVSPTADPNKYYVIFQKPLAASPITQSTIFTKAETPTVTAPTKPVVTPAPIPATVSTPVTIPPITQSTVLTKVETPTIISPAKPIATSAPVSAILPNIVTSGDTTKYISSLSAVEAKKSFYQGTGYNYTFTGIEQTSDPNKVYVIFNTKPIPAITQSTVFTKAETPTVTAPTKPVVTPAPVSAINYSPIQEADLTKLGYEPVASSASGGTIYTKPSEPIQPSYTETSLNIKPEDINITGSTLETRQQQMTNLDITANQAAKQEIINNIEQLNRENRKDLPTELQGIAAVGYGAASTLYLPYIAADIASGTMKPEELITGTIESARSDPFNFALESAGQALVAKGISPITGQITAPIEEAIKSKITTPIKEELGLKPKEPELTIKPTESYTLTNKQSYTNELTGETVSKAESQITITAEQSKLFGISKTSKDYTAKIETQSTSTPLMIAEVQNIATSKDISAIRILEEGSTKPKDIVVVSESKTISGLPDTSMDTTYTIGKAAELNKEPKYDIGGQYVSRTDNLITTTEGEPIIQLQKTTGFTEIVEKEKPKSIDITSDLTSSQASKITDFSDYTKLPETIEKPKTSTPSMGSTEVKLETPKPETQLATNIEIAKAITKQEIISSFEEPKMIELPKIEIPIPKETPIITQSYEPQQPSVQTIAPTIIEPSTSTPSQSTPIIVMPSQYDKVYESTGTELFTIPEMQTTITTTTPQANPFTTVTAFPSATESFPSADDGYAQLQPAQFNPIDASPFQVSETINLPQSSSNAETIISMPSNIQPETQQQFIPEITSIQTDFTSPLNDIISQPITQQEIMQTQPTIEMPAIESFSISQNIEQPFFTQSYEPTTTEAFTTPSLTQGTEQFTPTINNFIQSDISTPSNDITNTIIPITSSISNIDTSQSQSSIDSMIQNILPDTSTKSSSITIPSSDITTSTIQDILPKQDIIPIQNIAQDQGQAQKQDIQQIQELMQPQKTTTITKMNLSQPQRFRMPQVMSFKPKKTEEKKSSTTKTPLKMSKIYTRYKTRRKPIMSDPIARAITRSYGHMPQEPKITKATMEQSAFSTPTRQLQKRPTFLYGRSFILSKR